MGNLLDPMNLFQKSCLFNKCNKTLKVYDFLYNIRNVRRPPIDLNFSSLNDTTVDNLQLNCNKTQPNLRPVDFLKS